MKRWVKFFCNQIISKHEVLFKLLSEVPVLAIVAMNLKLMVKTYFWHLFNFVFIDF